MREHVIKSGLEAEDAIERADETPEPVQRRAWNCPNCGRRYMASIMTCQICLDKHNDELEDLLK